MENHIYLFTKRWIQLDKAIYSLIAHLVEPIYRYQLSHFLVSYSHCSLSRLVYHVYIAW